MIRPLQPSITLFRRALLAVAALSAAGLFFFIFIHGWDLDNRYRFFVLLLASLFALMTTHPKFFNRFVGTATPNQLGAIRILIGGILLWNILWEDFASSAYLPREMAEPRIMGLFQYLYRIPGFTDFISNHAALSAFEWTTTALILLATLGLRTRLTVPLAALGYVFLAALNRQYCWFYHVGLIPTYLLLVLSFTRCGDGLSLDRLLTNPGRRVPNVPAPHYGWARYACWVAVSLPYVAAGLSKIRNGGLMWWEAENLRAIIYRDSLNPMEFDFGLGMKLLHAPDFLIAFMGIATIIGELAFFLVLFSRIARLIVPAIMISMHLGIWALQNVLFFDLPLLLLMFYEPSEVRAAWHAWRGHRADELSHEPAKAGGWTPPIAIALMLTMLIAVWTKKLEFFPLTSMQMYSKYHAGGWVKDRYYYKPLATRASGKTTRAPLEKGIRAMADSRYRRALEFCFSPEQRKQTVCREYLRATTSEFNRKAKPEDVVVSLEVQQWEWNFVQNPDDPDHGDLVSRFLLDMTKSDNGSWQTPEGTAAAAPTKDVSVNPE